MRDKKCKILGEVNIKSKKTFKMLEIVNMEKWGIEKSHLTIIWQFEECGSILVKVVKEICQNRDGQIKIDGHLEDTFVQKITMNYHINKDLVLWKQKWIKQ